MQELPRPANARDQEIGRRGHEDPHLCAGRTEIHHLDRRWYPRRAQHIPKGTSKSPPKTQYPKQPQLTAPSDVGKRRRMARRPGDHPQEIRLSMSLLSANAVVVLGLFFPLPSGRIRQTSRHQVHQAQLSQPTTVAARLGLLIPFFFPLLKPLMHHSIPSRTIPFISLAGHNATYQMIAPQIYA